MEKQGFKKPQFLANQSDAARYLGVDRVTFNKLVKAGAIRGERIGGGSERQYCIYYVTELDQFQLDRSKERLGDKYDKQLEEAKNVVKYFQGYNDALIEEAMISGATFYDACKNARIEPRYLKDKITKEHNNYLGFLRDLCNYALKEYNGFPKTLKNWVNNQIYYHATDPRNAETRYFPNKPIQADQNGDAP